jgi:hypothetical protein
LDVFPFAASSSFRHFAASSGLFHSS